MAAPLSSGGSSGLSNGGAEALLSVFINQARSLPASDVNGKCDPYVVASLAGTDVCKRSEAFRKSRDPVWNARLNLMEPVPQAHNNNTGRKLLLQGSLVPFVHPHLAANRSSSRECSVRPR
jgi:hypothetical protein